MFKMGVKNKKRLRKESLFILSSKINIRID